MPLKASEVSRLRSTARLLARNFRTEGGGGGAGATNAKKKRVSSSSVEDATLKEYLSTLKSLPSSRINVSKVWEGVCNNIEQQSRISSCTPAITSLVGIFSDSLKSDPGDDDDVLTANYSNEIHQHLEVQCKADDALGSVLDFSLLLGISNSDPSLRKRRTASLEKKKWIFNNQEQSVRFNRLIRMCAKTFGPDAMLDVFGRLGQETGLNEFTALIDTCIETAKKSTDEDIALEQIHKAYQICKVVKESGFEISEVLYRQFLLYLIDRSMVEEFFLVYELINDQNLGSLPRLAYYEMLLWIRVEHKTKIQELCHRVMFSDSSEKFYLQESLILALAESNHDQELLMLLKSLDITRVTSFATLNCIFRALGKLMLEPYLERFLLALKKSGTEAEKISSCIYQYTIGMENLVDEDDMINKFQALHAMLDIPPIAYQYEKLIGYFCELLKVYEALHVVDLAHESGVALPLNSFQIILDACDQSCNFDLVHQIFSKLSSHNARPDLEAFRTAILLCVKMKDFEGAYQKIEELCKLDLKPTASIYNILLGGYFREKNTLGAMNVIKKMEDTDVKPDSVTYSYLISNSNSEDIIKYNDKLNALDLQFSKQVFMALINAYASSGQIEKAKQVILDERISGKDLNDIKNVLVGALASNGQLPTALDMYEEIKQAKCHIDSKTIAMLIEKFDSEDKLKQSLQLLEELNDSPYWASACFNIMSHCLSYENLRCAVFLLNRMKDKCISVGVSSEVLFDEVFCMYAESEPTNVQFGLSLLEAVKKTVNVGVTRKSLDFLLSACVRVKDSESALAIWKEYEAANLPYNVLSYMRMYQVFLASGDKESAAVILKKIPKDDPHVRCVIEASRIAYAQSESPKMLEMKTKKRRALAATLGVLNGLVAKTK